MPAFARRCTRTFQGFWLVAHAWAVCPPWAPSTSVTLGEYCPVAIWMKRENSWVVFDIPIETSAIRPEEDGAPWASLGTMLWDAVTAADPWPRGTLFLLPPYSPPDSPL